MTATDVLRRLLDERGVEWDADDEAMDDGSLSQVTYWYCNGIEWSADGRDEYLAFDAVQLLTPEQAIAATLLEAENAKLRELVKAMEPFLCCMPFASCNTLAANVRKRMRELGIEVDKCMGQQRTTYIPL